MNNSSETQDTKHFAGNEEVSERWQQIKKLFEAASGLAGKEREKFLKKACGDDSELRGEIEKLLASFEDSESFLESPAAEGVSLFENKATLAVNRVTSEVGKGDFVAGTVLASRYRILGLVGKGGMGEVYKADDLQLSQIVALKFLPESLTKDKAALARFRGEVRMARQVSHPNVCRVFDIGEIDGRHFLSMEFIDGDDLSLLLRRVGRLSSERAIEISRQLCVGMSAIHNAGILHRDFKPANIIIDSNGKVRITDFGIAGVEEEINQDKLRVGTPAYMSPEQIAGSEISIRSDIYALGLVLYEIFTGKQAFQADSIPELIRKHQSETPTNPSEFVKGIDPLVESVISQCLEKSPHDRPRSALHVAMALPGGNPMQIALEAGQTPSPEMIAAAPKKGALRPQIALLCLVGFTAAMLLTAYLHRFHKTYNFVPLEKSPEVLAEKAQTMIKNFGYTEKPADLNYRFVYETGFLQYAAENKFITNAGERLRAGQPQIMVLLYRQSPQSLEPWRAGRVFHNDPPLNLPGMINVSLDTTGRLVDFTAVPPQTLEKKSETAQPDWNRFFNEAGLDQTKFEKADPEWTPPVAFDEQFAWKGTMADFDDIPLRIEAASFQGRPVYFRIVAPWTKPFEVGHPYFGEPIWYLMFIGIFILATTSIGGTLLVWYNIKTGRADLKGTSRLVLFCLIGLLITLSIQYDHVPDLPGEIDVIGRIISDAVFYSIFTGILYCALEPFVRRWWAEHLISWNRLLGGDFRDPMVGRDILIGGFLAAISCLIWYFGIYAKEIVFGGSRIVNNYFYYDPPNSLPRAMAVLSDSILKSVTSGLGMLIVLLIFYFVTRRKKISLLLLGLILFAVNSSDETYLILFLSAAFNTLLLIITLNRFGLLALMSYIFFSGIGWSFPMTFDSSNFLFPATMMTLIVIFGIATYAAYLSIGGQQSWRGHFSDESVRHSIL